MAFKPKPMPAPKKLSPLARNAIRQPGKPGVEYREPAAPRITPPKTSVNNPEVARGAIRPTTSTIELEMTVLGVLIKFPMGYSESYPPIISLANKKLVERKPRRYGNGFDYHITKAGKEAWEKHQKNRRVGK